MEIRHDPVRLLVAALRAGDGKLSSLIIKAVRSDPDMSRRAWLAVAQLERLVPPALRAPTAVVFELVDQFDLADGAA
jgi:hypothetical protein